jgi:predicted PurR-regulated permease PerM
VSRPLFLYIRKVIMSEAWSLTRDIAEVVGMFLVPVMAWVMYTILSHGKQIIILEEKVNDSLNRRMAGIEEKVVSMESKIENKIDGLEKNIVECKIAINNNASNLNSIGNSITNKFDTLIDKIEDIR